MGVQLLGEKYSLKNMGAGEDTSALSYTEMFYRCLPQYLAMGMSADEFWNCDPRMYKVYRELDRIKTEKENQRLWLEGMYVYQAILLSAPRLNSLKPEEPVQYPAKPFDLGLDKKEEPEMTDEEIRKTPQFARVMEWAIAVNKQKGSDANGK